MQALKPRRKHGPVSTKQYGHPDGRYKIPNVLSLPLDQFVSPCLQENAAPTTESRRGGSQQSAAKPELTDLFGPAKSGRRTSTGTEAQSPAPTAAAPSPAKPLALRQGVATSPVPAAPGSGSVGTSTSASKGVASKKEREPVNKGLDRIPLFGLTLPASPSSTNFQHHAYIPLGVYIFPSQHPTPADNTIPWNRSRTLTLRTQPNPQNPCGSSLETARGPQGL